MTDKEKIIDGINVSECKYFQSSCVPDYSGGYLYKNVCRNHGFYDCDKKPCAFKCTEYQKQLKRKERECEELKREIAFGNNGKLSDKIRAIVFKNLNAENSKYKQALDEIEKIVIKANSISSLDSDEIRQIRNIINEAKEK